MISTAVPIGAVAQSDSVEDYSPERIENEDTTPPGDEAEQITKGE